MFRRIDQSEFLMKVLQSISDFLARRRGVPILVGIVLIAIGFVLQLVNVGADSQLIEVLHIIFHNVGLIAALIGILLIEPLGGY